jgi:hypothetical protein
MWVPGYRNSIVHTLEIGVGFRKHPVVKEYFLHGDKYIFSCSLNYSQNYLLIRTPLTPSQKYPNITFSFPTVKLFAVAVYVDKPNTTDISIYSSNGSNNRHAHI